MPFLGLNQSPTDGPSDKLEAEPQEGCFEAEPRNEVKSVMGKVAGGMIGLAAFEIAFESYGAARGVDGWVCEVGEVRSPPSQATARQSSLDEGWWSGGPAFASYGAAAFARAKTGWVDEDVDSFRLRARVKLDLNLG